MRRAKERKVNVLEMKRLRSSLGVSRMEKLGIMKCLEELE